MQLFPADGPLSLVAIDILDPLTKTTKGYQYLLVIFDHFTEPTLVIPLKRIDAYVVAVAFVEHWL